MEMTTEGLLESEPSVGGRQQPPTTTTTTNPLLYVICGGLMMVIGLSAAVLAVTLSHAEDIIITQTSSPPPPPAPAGNEAGAAAPFCSSRRTDRKGGNLGCPVTAVALGISDLSDICQGGDAYNRWLAERCGHVTVPMVRTFLGSKACRNWDRWPANVGGGTLNLISASNRLRATAAIRTGETVSVSRSLSYTTLSNLPAPFNTTPGLDMYYDGVTPGKVLSRRQGNLAADGGIIRFHGGSYTHMDSVCHTWDIVDGKKQAFGGFAPTDIVKSTGCVTGDVMPLAGGVVTRGVLIDIPRFRQHRNGSSPPYVTQDNPVQGWELEEALELQCTTLKPGDAVLVYSGREKFTAANGGSYSTKINAYRRNRPGLDLSTIPFFRANDVSVLGWDMLDVQPDPVLPTDDPAYDPAADPDQNRLAWGVHGTIYGYGLILIDNMLLEPLADQCAQRKQYDFMFTAHPLPVPGATGSAVNPVVVM